MANRTLPAGQPYSGRHPGIVVKALSLDKEAVGLLIEMAPTPKAFGAFISGLICAEHARRMERQRLQRLLADGDESPTAA